MNRVIFLRITEYGIIFDYNGSVEGFYPHGSFHAVSYKNDNGVYENSFYLNTEHEEEDIMFFKSDVSLAKELSVRTLGIVNVIP